MNEEFQDMTRVKLTEVGEIPVSTENKSGDNFQWTLVMSGIRI